MHEMVTSLHFSIFKGSSEFIYMNYQNCPFSKKYICAKKSLYKCLCQLSLTLKKKNNTKIISLTTTKGMNNMK